MGFAVVTSTFHYSEHPIALSTSPVLFFQASGIIGLAFDVPAGSVATPQTTGVERLNLV
jgi:hypothetical protein